MHKTISLGLILFIAMLMIKPFAYCVDLEGQDRKIIIGQEALGSNNTEKTRNANSDCFKVVDKDTVGAIKITADVNDVVITINDIFIGYTPKYIIITPKAVTIDSELYIKGDVSALSPIHLGGPCYCAQSKKIKCSNTPIEIKFEMECPCKNYLYPPGQFRLKVE